MRLIWKSSTGLRNLSPGTAFAVDGTKPAAAFAQRAYVASQVMCTESSGIYSGAAMTEPNVSGDRISKLELARAVRARQQVIGRELRRMYDSVIQEPVPDDFLELLRKMDIKDKASGNGSI
jgi:hypothetical protein